MNCQVHSKVFKELADASIEVSKFLGFGSLGNLRDGLPRRFSLFGYLPHPMNTFCPRTAECIWDAGFRPDMENFDLEGNIQNREGLDCVLWVMSKGIKISNISFHKFVSEFQYWSTYISPEKGSAWTELFRPFWQLFCAGEGIEHDCLCCADGCVPALAIMSKGPGSRELLMSGLSLVEECVGDACHRYLVSLAPKMVRCVLFNFLELTHSLNCCKRKWRDSHGTEQDIMEKQEEEWYLRSRLDPLTQELSAEFDRYNMPMSRFLEERVEFRAKQVLEGEEEPLEKDRQIVRRIGVVLEEIGDEP